MSFSRSVQVFSMNKQGLTLKELMAYLALTVMITTLTSILSLSLYRTAQQRTAANDAVLSISIALHSLARDLKEVPICAIKEASNQSCIITGTNKDLGWVYKKDKLMRYTGDYNQLTKQWSQRGSSQLASSLHGCTFTYHWQKGHLKGISCRLSKYHITLELYVGLV